MKKEPLKQTWVYNLVKKVKFEYGPEDELLFMQRQRKPNEQ